MATIVFCRHGTSLWNLEKRWQGEQDIDLAAEGEEQARVQAEFFASAGMKFDAIYSSDLKRAFHTAQVLGTQDGLEVVSDRRLRECSLGAFEGSSCDEIKGPKYAHIFERLNALPQEERIRAAYFNGLETPMDMASRACAVASEVAARYGADARVLIVTHSTIMEAILAVEHGYHFEGISVRNLAWFQWEAGCADGARKISDMDGCTFSDGIGIK